MPALQLVRWFCTSFFQCIPTQLKIHRQWSNRYFDQELGTLVISCAVWCAIYQLCLCL